MLQIVIFVLTAATIIFAYKYFALKSRVLVVEDVKPEGKTAMSKVLRLSNELEPYVETKNGKVRLTILKSKK